MSTSILEALARLNELLHMYWAYATALQTAAHEHCISESALDAAYRNQP